MAKCSPDNRYQHRSKPLTTGHEAGRVRPVAVSPSVKPLTAYGEPVDSSAPPPRRWWRRKVIVIPAALLTAAVIALAAVVITSQRHENPHGPRTAPPIRQTQTAQAAPSGPTAQPAYGPALELPFTGLKNPRFLAVDAAGNAYVFDYDNKRVVKLAADSSMPTVLPFTGFDGPRGMTVDSAGNLYVTDFLNNQVVKLAAGSSNPVVLPFTGLHDPGTVAVDAAGDLYVTDRGNRRVVKLAAGSPTQTVLPLNLNFPTGVAVDGAGNLYISDLALYISDPGRDNPGHGVLKLAAGSTIPTVLWSEGNHSAGPGEVAVDAAGNVYFAEGLSDTRSRVLKLPVR